MKPATLQPRPCCQSIAKLKYSPIVLRSVTAMIKRYTPMRKSATARLIIRNLETLIGNLPELNFGVRLNWFEFQTKRRILLIRPQILTSKQDHKDAEITEQCSNQNEPDGYSQVVVAHDVFARIERIRLWMACHRGVFFGETTVLSYGWLYVSRLVRNEAATFAVGHHAPAASPLIFGVRVLVVLISAHPAIGIQKFGERIVSLGTLFFWILKSTAMIRVGERSLFDGGQLEDGWKLFQVVRSLQSKYLKIT